MNISCLAGFKCSVESIADAKAGSHRYRFKVGNWKSYLWINNFFAC